jgi:hypothetical protein
MLGRSTLLFSLSLLIAGCLYASEADTQDVSFNKPVQVPETILQPGQYKIHLEDHLADRAIVRITDPSGADHYVLTVPTKKLKAASKGLIFFHDSTGAEAVQGWACSSCAKPLEFVYPKDEAVKLTAETGTPVMAYDASYDKLPANLTAADRKVVTLWLLSPKTITPDGKGEGLTAAKLTAPKMMASSEPLPKKMPKTSTSAFDEIAIGLLTLTLALIFALRRRLQPATC